ncbi:MAG: hypothetical protein RR365_06185 [Bacteroides sp.]
MATSYSALYEWFYRRIEKDIEFFNYFNLTDKEAMELAEKRAFGYMNEAVAKITLECQPSVDFSKRDDTLKQFNFDLNDTEFLIISSVMYQYYLDRDIPHLLTLNVNFTPTELKVFDPSGARGSFMSMYKFLCEQNDSLLDKYKDTDRETGKNRTVDFSINDK